MWASPQHKTAAVAPNQTLSAMVHACTQCLRFSGVSCTRVFPLVVFQRYACAGVLCSCWSAEYVWKACAKISDSARKKLGWRAEYVLMLCGLAWKALLCVKAYWRCSPHFVFAHSRQDNTKLARRTFFFGPIASWTESVAYLRRPRMS